MCPRDIEIYLLVVFFYLAAALPHHNIYKIDNEVRYRERRFFNIFNVNYFVVVSAGFLLLFIHDIFLFLKFWCAVDNLIKIFIIYRFLFLYLPV